jgi:predicted molibdopterin-dependent oxidoreductase YjgC
MSAALEGKVRAMYILGENPLLSDPDLNHVERALRKLDFLVVQDIFANETAQSADVVLPGVSFAEKAGTYTNTERRVQLIRPALDSPGHARQDWAILTDLARRLGADWSYSAPAMIFDEMARLTPSYAGISHERLEHGGIQWPCPTPDHPGTAILHSEKFARGMGLFSVVEYRPPAESPDAEFPLILSTGRVLFHWHGGTLTRRSPGLDELAPEAEVEIHPADADNLGIDQGEIVTVASRRGKIHAKAHLTYRSPRGTVFMTFHYAEAPANLLTGDHLDPVAKIPEYKVSAVRIERAMPVGG